MKSFKTHILTEGAGLSRILRHMQDSPFGVVSAFRNEYTLKENLERTKDMQNMVRREGYGYIRMEGGWIEDGDKEVTENSIFIIGSPDEDFDEFASFINEVGTSFDQEAVIVGDMTDVLLLYPDGNHEKIGSVDKINTTSVGEFFSKIKGKKFAFAESVEDIIDALEFGPTAGELADALAEAFAHERIEFQIHEACADVGQDEVLFGGWFDSGADQDGEASIQIDMFVNWEGEEITNETWQKRKPMLIDTIKHELRHRYQYEQRDYAPQRLSESYLSNPDEIDAFAVNIADELYREYGDAARINFKNLNETALARNVHGELVSPSLYGYWREHFNTSDVMKSLIRKTVKHLNEFKAPEQDLGLFRRTKPVSWNKRDPLIHATPATNVASILRDGLKTTEPHNIESEIAPPEHKDDRFVSFAFSSKSAYVQRLVKNSGNPVAVFEIDPRVLRLKYDMYGVDFRDVYRKDRGGVIHRLGLGDEKEVRVYTGQDKTIKNFTKAVKSIHVLSKPDEQFAQAVKSLGIEVFFYNSSRKLLANLPK